MALCMSTVELISWARFDVVLHIIYQNNNTISMPSVHSVPFSMHHGDAEDASNPYSVDGNEEEKEETATAEVDTCVCKSTTIFLVGRHFSVHDTSVIAGGKCVPDMSLLSRETMQVTIPPGVHPVTYRDPIDHKIKKYIDIHIATPYGVTNHLLVPVYDSGIKAPIANVVGAGEVFHDPMDLQPTIQYD